VVAEGTETDEQIIELKRLGCEMTQGFLYSPPVDPAQAFDLLLASHQQVQPV
jgi:EAL domain-containing protein (putative c-di-GMP-specific phosphodiesterase class I)